MQKLHSSKVIKFVLNQNITPILVIKKDVDYCSPLILLPKKEVCFGSVRTWTNKVSICRNALFSIWFVLTLGPMIKLSGVRSEQRKMKKNIYITIYLGLSFKLSSSSCTCKIIYFRNSVLPICYAYSSSIENPSEMIKKKIIDTYIITKKVVYFQILGKTFHTTLNKRFLMQNFKILQHYQDKCI